MGLHTRDAAAGAVLGGGAAILSTLSLMQRYMHRELAPPFLCHRKRDEADTMEEVDLLMRVKLLLRDYWPHPVLEFSGTMSTSWSGLWAMLPATVHPGRVEVLTLEDGGTISLHWCDPPAASPNAASQPGIVLVVPGINNDSRTGFIQASMKHLQKEGFQAVTMNIRGAGGLGLTSPRFGCADSWRDLGAVVDHLEASHPGRTLYAMGFSMGGCMLLRYMGEEGPRCRFKAVVTIAAPTDSLACAEALDSTLKKRVMNFFMVTGCKMMMSHTLFNPIVGNTVDKKQVLTALSLRQLDEASIIPTHGYSKWEDYHGNSSPRPVLHRISVPTLLVNAADDPVVGYNTIAFDDVKKNPKLYLAVTRRGGHIGWSGGGLVGETAWTDHVAAEFMRACASTQSSPRSRL